MPEKFKRIKREIIRKSSILTYCDDTLLLPDGREVVYDTMLHNGAVAVVAVTDEGRIVMVRQYRHTFDRITLEIPAGKRDGDEEHIEAAKRELLEETGYRASSMEHFITIDTAIAYCNEEIEVFLAEGLKKEKQHLDPDEFIDVEEYDPEALFQMVLRGKIRDSKTIASLMAYFSYRKLQFGTKLK